MAPVFVIFCGYCVGVVVGVVVGGCVWVSVVWVGVREYSLGRVNWHACTNSFG